MEQSDKDLLIKDLCARLPYGVKARIIISNKPLKWYDAIVDGRYIDSFFDKGESAIKDIKPYLFPLSSMTEEQRKEFNNLAFITGKVFIQSVGDSVDWLNAHHFDYRGLLDRGLAIDATNLNIY